MDAHLVLASFMKKRYLRTFCSCTLDRNVQILQTRWCNTLCSSNIIYHCFTVFPFTIKSISVVHHRKPVNYRKQDIASTIIFVSVWHACLKYTSPMSNTLLVNLAFVDDSSMPVVECTNFAKMVRKRLDHIQRSTCYVYQCMTSLCMRYVVLSHYEVFDSVCQHLKLKASLNRLNGNSADFQDLWKQTKYSKWQDML